MPHRAQKLQPTRSPGLAARGVIDLRRNADRAQVEALWQRARHLSAHEQVLVEGVFRDGRSLLEITRLLATGSGVEASALLSTSRRFSRTLKRAVRRMSSPLFQFVAARCDHAGDIAETPAWPEERRRIGEMVVLRGVPVTRAARQLKMERHRALEHLRAIEAMCVGATS